MRFTPTAPGLLACRFAWSAVHELAAAVRVLARPVGYPSQAGWLRQVGPALGRVDLTVLRELFAPKRYNPDFLLPPPLTAGEDLAAGLARVAAASPAQVAQELALAFPPNGRVLGLPADPEAARDRAVTLLAAAWEVLVAPWWPRIREALEADIAYHAHLLAELGLGDVLADLSPGVRLADGVVDVLHIGGGVAHELGPRGVVLVPSVFASPDVGVSTVEGQPALIGYGARGAAAVWEQSRPSADTLAALVGRTRAGLLTALDEPASTSGLALRCGVPLSSTSDHLAVLRAAGLVTTTRVGHALVHRRTPLGTALCDG